MTYMKALITVVLILPASLPAQARLMRNWSYQELLDKSDLVVVATPTATNDAKERRTPSGPGVARALPCRTGQPATRQRGCCINRGSKPAPRLALSDDNEIRVENQAHG